MGGAEREVWPRDDVRAPLPGDRDVAAVVLARRYAGSRSRELAGSDLPVAMQVLSKSVVGGGCRWLIATSPLSGVLYDVTYDSRDMAYRLDVYNLVDSVEVPAEARYA